MGRVILLIVSTLIFLQLQAADTTLHLQPVATIPGSYSDFYTDNLQNIYLISSATNQIKKLRSNGDSVGVYNNVIRYGKIYSLDVTNPLKILVYYKEFATIVILDRFLATRSIIDLRRLGIQQVKAVSQSYDSNIWLYDELEGKIKKVDENNSVLLESSDLRLVFDDSLSPQKIIDNNGQLYLYDNRLGWLIFDYYMAFKKKLPFNHWKDVNTVDNILYGRENNRFLYASQNDIDFHSLQSNLVADGIIKTKQQQGKLYVLTKEGINIYGIVP